MVRSKSSAACRTVLIVLVGSLFMFFRARHSLQSLESEGVRVKGALGGRKRASLLPFRMLIGIFSTDDPKERKQRSLIRNTYLSLHKLATRYNISNLPLRESRICSLYELWYGNLTQSEQCQLLYTFVVGGASLDNRDARTEYVDIRPNWPMTLPRLPGSEEPNDITVLNILENMNEGKSQTWFKFASSQIPEYLGIDMIAKADTDCLVYPSHLINQIESIGTRMGLEPPFRSVYGGSRQRGNDTSYMQGGFYFMSTDLAAHITSKDCDRQLIISKYIKEYKNKRAEDVEISRFVLDYPGLVHEMEIPIGKAYAHDFRMKNKDKFRDTWKWFVASLVAQDRLQTVQAAFNTTCPPDQALEDAKNAIDSELVRMKSRFSLLVKQLEERCGGRPRM